MSSRITITLNYGYDIHSIEVDRATYERIKAGEKVTMDGQGFSDEEDGWMVDHWVFNKEPNEEAYFRLDNAAEFRGEVIGVSSESGSELKGWP
jgi:hypothetical protein